MTTREVIYNQLLVLVRKVGIEPLSPVFRPQVTDSSFASSASNSTNLPVWYTCDKPISLVVGYILGGAA